MTYLFVIVGALVFFFCYWRWTKRKMEREERVASFKGKLAICPFVFPVVDNEPTATCSNNIAEIGVYKRDRPVRGGTEFDCAGCGTKSIWDMDRVTPVLIDWDKPREPRKPRRPRRQ